MADLRLNILGKDEASVSLDSVQGKVLGLGKVLADFAKQSVKAFEDQAKADRQLAAVAGTATDAFKAQASALQESLGVSDDHVQKLQTMLLRYGEAPAEIDKTVRAILDFSAATGQDAEAAISQLTSSVTTGKAAFRDLGLQYDQTGSRGDVLKAATEALAKKFGGSAAGEAGSLTGSAERAKAQIGELKETFGALFSTLLTKSGVVETFTEKLKAMNAALNPKMTMGGNDQGTKAALEYELKTINETLTAYNQMSVVQKQAFRDSAEANREFGARGIPETIARQKELIAQLKAGAGELKKVGEANNIAAGTKKGGGSDDSMANFKESLRDRIDAITDAAERESKLWEEHDRAQAAAEAEAERDRLNTFKEGLDERIAAITDGYVQEAKEADKRDAEFAKQEQQYAQAGLAIGAAFANSLSSAIAEAASGGEVDAGEVVGDILSGILGVAGAALGTVIGGPAGTAIGGALGGLAGSAIRGATRKKRHLGGYAGDGMARYHTGTWVGSDEEAAILQNGERILSRSEVAGMGGPQGVERAVSGGGRGSTVNIQTFDAGSFREIFQGRGGRGLLDAARTGVGAPALLFGGR